MSNGRIVLNNHTANNDTRQNISSIVTNEVSLLGGVRENGVWYRGTDNKDEINYLKDGTMKNSVNHDTGTVEDGVSVWEVPKYESQYLYKVRGELSGIGSDGEPVIKPTSIKLVSDKSSWRDIFKQMEQGKQAFREKYGWSEKQLDTAMKGFFDKKERV